MRYKAPIAGRLERGPLLAVGLAGAIVGVGSKEPHGVNACIEKDQCTVLTLSCGDDFQIKFFQSSGTLGMNLPCPQIIFINAKIISLHVMGGMIKGLFFYQALLFYSRNQF